ncbi:hypothetical protein H4R35_007577, partial [Dimargaris xerosporica]
RLLISLTLLSLAIGVLAKGKKVSPDATIVSGRDEPEVTGEDHYIYQMVADSITEDERKCMVEKNCYVSEKCVTDCFDITRAELEKEAQCFYDCPAPQEDENATGLPECEVKCRQHMKEFIIKISKASQNSSSTATSSKSKGNDTDSKTDGSDASGTDGDDDSGAGLMSGSMLALAVPVVAAALL